ncbi:uncharacterized protein [Rutidosis leptorrhynchoides]|uniref:uncharacterized protein n=1 Tax=Rutidosis leptorrhynchoides TaxID=125765 RepID=UPI003A98DF7B
MDTLFRGETVVFGGDFRQILPVIQKGKREDVVDASLNSSYLWDYVIVSKLTVNMRLCGNETDADTRIFAQWILNIRNGDVGESEDRVFDIEIPQDLLITYLDEQLQRAILAPTHEVVNIINDRMMMSLAGEERSYSSSHSICASQRDADFNNELYTTDFLNSIEIGGLPKHNLRLQISVLVMLLRNIDQAGGLCNGTRLQIVHLGDKIIKANILTGSNVGKITALSRMLIVPMDKNIPFRFQRRQYPLYVDLMLLVKVDGSWQTFGLDLIEFNEYMLIIRIFNRYESSKRRGYYNECISTWYPNIPADEVHRGKIREIHSEEKLEHLFVLLSLVLPVIKQVHSEQC